MNIQVSRKRDATDKEEKSIQRIDYQWQHGMTGQAFRYSRSGQVEEGKHCKY